VPLEDVESYGITVASITDQRGAIDTPSDPHALTTDVFNLDLARQSLPIR
jgi:hypothetical protein